MIKRESAVSPSQPGRRVKYCLLKDNQNFQEMYNLDTDPDEFKNLAVTLPEDKKKDYLNLIEHMEMCSGESCHV